MKQKYSYDYPRPSVAADALIFGVDDIKNEIFILLIERLREPFAGKWALPGGFMEFEESAEECVARELQEETGFRSSALHQLMTASKRGRDPRGHTVSVVFWAVENIDYGLSASDDAKSLRWFRLTELPPLAFDHAEIIDIAIKKLTHRLMLKEYYPSFFANLSPEAMECLSKMNLSK